MVWGCMSYFGVGKLTFIDTTMDQYIYMNILRFQLLPSACVMGIKDTFSFYQDNDPKHKAKSVQEWLTANCSNVLQTPPQSPDLNPIENLWSFLEREIRKHVINNVNDLKTALQEEWTKIPVQYVKRLVESMPRRLEAVIKSKGYPTKY